MLKEEIEKIVKEPIEPNWSKEEFKTINFGDKRIDKRFQKVSEELSLAPSSPINQACGGWGDTKAAYRLFDNKKVKKELIFEEHQKLTQERIKSHNIVLAIQDTTYLNYTNHEKKEGIGPIGTKEQDIKGLIMHSTLAETVNGVPLGLLCQDIWARSEKEEKVQKKKKKDIPIEEKESSKWLKSLEETEKLKVPGTTFITICDREADIYEFFVKARDLDNKIIVRATQNRKLSGEIDNLWEFLEKQPVKGTKEVKVSGKKKEENRTAILEVRYATVTISPPKNLKASEKKKLGTITVDAVLAKEVNAPDKVEPLEWLLLTNLSVKTYEDAIQILAWYERRWDIELYHKILKSGCKIEDCRLQTTDRLIPYITLQSIIGWRLLWMTRINREQPNAPCTVILDKHEWEALFIKTQSSTKLPEKIPTVREAIRWIGQLGGFLARKRDKEPGITAIWRGWKRLNDMASMWLIVNY